MNFPSQIFFNAYNHGYRAAILKKNSFRLSPFFMAVTTFFYYENVRRTMRSSFVSYLVKEAIVRKYSKKGVLKIL